MIRSPGRVRESRSLMGKLSERELITLTAILKNSWGIGREVKGR